MQHGTKQTMVRFESQTDDRDPISNEPLDVWDPVVEPWVRLEAKRVTEKAMLDSREVQITHLCFGDHDDLEQVTDEMRMVWDPTETFKNGAGYVDAAVFFRITGVQRDYVQRRQTIIHLTEVDEHAAN